MATTSSVGKIQPVEDSPAPAAEPVLESVKLDPAEVERSQPRTIGDRLGLAGGPGALRWLGKASTRFSANGLMFLALVVIPTVIYSGYMFFVATPLFVAESKFAIRSLGTQQGGDIASGLFANISSKKAEDANQVLAFVESSNMLAALDEQAGFSAKASTGAVDYFTRLNPQAPIEERLAYYLKFIDISFDEHAGLFTLKVEALTPTDAIDFIRVIIAESESLINEISVNLARRQLDFIQEQVDAKKAEYLAVSKRIVATQNEMSLLDPTGDAVSINTLIYQLESELASDRSELGAKRSYLTEGSTEIFQLKQRIEAKKQQIADLRKRLVGNQPATMNMMANRFKALELEAQLARQTYTTALQSLEAARVGASEGLKKLVVVVRPFTPEEATEPNALSDSLTFLAFSLVGFFLILVIIQVAREHRD